MNRGFAGLPAVDKRKGDSRWRQAEYCRAVGGRKGSKVGASDSELLGAGLDALKNVKKGVVYAIKCRKH